MQFTVAITKNGKTSVVTFEDYTQEEFEKYVNIYVTQGYMVERIYLIK